MFNAIVSNMESARETGDLYQGSVTETLANPPKEVPITPEVKEVHQETTSGFPSEHPHSSQEAPEQPITELPSNTPEPQPQLTPPQSSLSEPQQEQPIPTQSVQQDILSSQESLSAEVSPQPQSAQPPQEQPLMSTTPGRHSAQPTTLSQPQLAQPPQEQQEVLPIPTQDQLLAEAREVSPQIASQQDVYADELSI